MAGRQAGRHAAASVVGRRSVHRFSTLLNRTKTT